MKVDELMLQSAVHTQPLERRKDARFAAPISVKVLGLTIPVADWSLIGLRVADFPGDLPVIDQELRLRLNLNHKSLSVSIACWADVVRVEPQSHMFAVQYTSIEPSDFDLFEAYAKIIANR